MFGIGNEMARKDTVYALLVRALMEIEYSIAHVDLRKLWVKDDFPVRQNCRFQYLGRSKELSALL